MPKYPKINYIGNKEKLSNWICDYFPKDANSLFDAFSGGCSLSYEAKKRGLEVYSNDILKINYHIANSLIQNSKTTLTQSDIEIIFQGYPIEGFMFDNYSNVYYHPEECKELDLYRKNLDFLECPEKKSLALVLLRRAMIRKMPYSRFNIKWNKILNLRDEEYSYTKYKRKRAYHNQSFKHHFIENVNHYNSAIFDNFKNNIAYNDDVFNLLGKVKADIIYLDPPYTGTMNNYFSFYGLFDNYITSTINEPFQNNFIIRKESVELFDILFSKLNDYKYWLLSYNDSSFPNKNDMLTLLKKYSKDIDIFEKKHNYQITGINKKQNNSEILFLVKN